VQINVNTCFLPKSGLNNLSVIWPMTHSVPIADMIYKARNVHSVKK